jgi:hypothetical protein
MIDAVVLVIVIFIISLLFYAMFVSLSSLITQLKRDVQSIIYGVEERLMVEISWDRSTLRNIEEKIDKLNIKTIEDIKKGDEIVDENNDFYFVTYVYGDKVDGISKNGIVREGMEIGEVKKTGKHGMVRIDTTVDEEPEWI